MFGVRVPNQLADPEDRGDQHQVFNVHVISLAGHPAWKKHPISNSPLQPLAQKNLLCHSPVVPTTEIDLTTYREQSRKLDQERRDLWKAQNKDWESRRKKVVSLHNKGIATAEIARQMNVSHQRIGQILKAAREQP